MSFETLVITFATIVIWFTVVPVVAVILNRRADAWEEKYRDE